MSKRKFRVSDINQQLPAPTMPTRRNVLAGSMLAGAAATLPGWLTGCGLMNFDTAEVAGAARERRTLHFDFSHIEPGTKFTFNAPRSASHRATIKQHTAQTRTRYRRENVLLRQISDEQLTHYLDKVDLPGDALQHCWITTDGADGLESHVSSHLHVPSYAYSSLANAKRRASSLGNDAPLLDPQKHPKLQHLKISQLTQQTATAVPTLSDLNSIHTPVDAATAVVFHHPEIMNLDPTQAAKVLDVIASLQGSATSCTGDNVGVLLALACAIASQGPGSTTSGWTRMVAAVDSTGAAVLDSSGNQIYETQISDATTDAAEPVIKEILSTLYADADLNGANLSSDPGLSSVSGDAASGSAAGKSRSTAADSSSPFQVSLSHPTGGIGSNVHGLIFRDFSVTNGDTRSVSLEVENIYLRFCEAYVQYLQADKKTPIAGDDGNPMKPQHLAIVPTDQAIMGIPLLDQGTLEKTTLAFDMPEAASFANILFGTLGACGKSVGDRDQFSQDDVMGSAMAWTLVFNIGIPSFLLAVGVGLQASGLLKSITSDPEILAAVVSIVVPIYIAAQATQTAVRGSARPAIVQTANILIGLCIKQIPKLAVKLTEYTTTEELIDAVPFVGWAVRALGMVGGIAQLAETTGEILSSPAVFDNTVSFAMDSTVTVSHDPLDFEFPATAKTWIVRATYDGTVVREVCGSLPTTQSDPIVAKFTGVPVGGKVRYDVWFLSDDNWIVGQGGTGHWEDTGQTDETGAPVQRWVPETISNFPEQAGAVAITIKEQLVPLTQSTVYSHKEKLAYSGGAYAWQAASAPQQTVANLNSSRNDALHALGMITVNQAAGSVGYTWRTGTPAINTCPGDNGTAVSLQLVQGLSLTQRPGDAYKAPDCGRIDKPAIAYRLMSPLGSTGQNLFVDPKYGPYNLDDRSTLPYKYFVRSVTLNSLTDTTPLASAAGQAWGYFALPSDGLAVHPTGHVISINTANNKMEILHLPGTPTTDANAQSAAMMSGRGALAGLLSGPAAVGVAPNGAVLVLDAGNARVQAFDVYGSVNNIYKDASGNPVNSFALKSTNATRYLDMAIEAAVGYVFVLYFENDGSQPSDYVLDIYTKDGAYLTQTRGMNVARIALDYWRNVYSLNFESITGPNSRLEPSISQWIPSTPPGHDPNALAALAACSQ